MNMKKKKVEARSPVCAALALFLSVALTACGQEAAPNTSAADDVPSTAPITSREPTKSDLLKQSAADSLADFYADEEISNVTVGSSKIEVTILSPIMAGDPLPDDWQTVCNTAKTASGSIQQVAEDNELTYGIVYIKDADDTILATARNGNITYDAFEAAAAAANNPSTISLAEYNRIQSGMTYQQVCDIIGGPGEVQSQIDLGLGSEYRMDTYSWDGDGGMFSYAIISFTSGVVDSKLQVGLE